MVEFTGDGTVVSQLEAFATASVVVGPHGAGLSNIVVSSLHTPVLEIGPISCSTCFLHLAIKVELLLLATDNRGLCLPTPPFVVLSAKHCPSGYLSRVSVFTLHKLVDISQRVQELANVELSPLLEHLARLMWRALLFFVRMALERSKCPPSCEHCFVEPWDFQSLLEARTRAKPAKYVSEEDCD